LKLSQLRNDLCTLQSAVGAGDISPMATSIQLGQLVEAIQAMLAELAKAPDGDMALIRGEASAALFDLLTPREREVAQAVLTYGTSVLAAHTLGMSTSTLGHHRSNILRKLGANSFAQVASILATNQPDRLISNPNG
jgi:DNA-binding NarL/FixJ family response regulator